jgi:hypothetical protein
MTDVKAQPPVTAALQNGDGTANIYVTQDPAVNRLTLTLTAAPGVDVQLPAGSPVEYGTLPSGQSAIYLFFEGLLANAEIKEIDFAAPGWAANTFTDPNSTLQYLVIAPKTAVSLASDSPLTFSLTNVLVAEQPTSGTGDVDLAGATGISPDDADASLFINIANPPQPKNKVLDADVVDIGFDNASLYTGQPDTLVLHLINQTDQALVPGGSAAWGPSPPTFTLTVLYGDQVGDLTALGNAHDITGAIANTYGNVWKPVANQDQGDKRSWQMQPDKNGGGDVLGSGAQATIEFSFSPIDATLPAGLDEAYTVAYVSWSGVPGYNDGSLGIPITKRAGPSISTFTANPGIFGYGGTSLETMLTWKAANADSVTFDVPGVPPAQTFHESGTGPLKHPVTVPAGTKLGITAYKTIEAARPELADDQISASETLVLPEVKRIDVPVQLQNLPVFVIAPSGATGYVLDYGGTTCTEIDLSAMKLTRTWDMAGAVKSPLQVRGVIGATVSPDGNRIHAAVIDESTYDPWLLSLDPVGATVTAQVNLATLQSNQQATSASVAASPDGTTLYVSSQVTTSTSSAITTAPYALDVIDVASYTVATTFLWNGNAAAGTISATDRSGRLLLDTGAGMAVVETEGPGGVRVTSQLNLATDYELFALPPSLPTADRSTAYVMTLDGTTLDKDKKTAELALAIVDIDPATGALSFARKVPLGLIADAEADVFIEILTWWGGGTNALSRDETTLYFLDVPTGIGLITLADMSVQTWGCGPEGFVGYPFATGPQPGVVYVMQIKPMVLSAISVGPPTTADASTHLQAAAR